jgi:transcriptional regulator with XRE-family HTH domain/mannose-6-phosphate isomerase-like protein (cupin superfamily)
VTVEDEVLTTGAVAPAANNASGGEGDSAGTAQRGDAPAPGAAGNSTGALDIVGSRVREERLSQKIGVRELARRVGVSASLISQVELGKASPSVGTLYAIVNELGLSLDELFFQHSNGRPPRGRGRTQAGDGVSSGAAQRGGGDRSDPAVADPGHEPGQPWGAEPLARGVDPVVRRGTGKVIQLATGVRWERLAPPTPQDVDFLEVAYQPGSESCPPDSLMRHSGHEYGHIIRGRMGVTVGFDTYELGPGDSVAFDSTMPHRLFTIGEEPVEAIWVVVGRRGDARLGHGH